MRQFLVELVNAGTHSFPTDMDITAWQTMRITVGVRATSTDLRGAILLITINPLSSAYFPLKKVSSFISLKPFLHHTNRTDKIILKTCSSVKIFT